MTRSRRSREAVEITKMPGTSSDTTPSQLASQERRLRRHLGFWGLTAIGFSNMVGSGWLFAALYAAQIAGPASLLTWVVAGVLCALVGLVMVELGASRPEGGGTVRWPLYANGRLVGSVVGWSVLLSVGGTAAEISAILQYAGHYLPWLYEHGSITLLGLVVGIAVAAVLTAVNWLTVRAFARINNLVTILKVAVPVLTVMALLASSFTPSRLTDPGGFAPYGYSAALSALAGGGIVYSVNGFQAPVDFSGEARNPRRTIPASVLAGIGMAVLLYLGLQLAFLFAVPDTLLGQGWAEVNFESPFGQLALILNLQWISTLLYADAVLSPGGSANVGIGLDARHTYALAKSRLLPRYFTGVDPKSGIPRRALLLNIALVVIFLLPFSGWQDIVAVMGDMYLITYATSAVAVATFRGTDRSRLAGWVKGLRVLAPLGFIIASEFIYWSGWHHLRLVIPLLLLGVVPFIARSRDHAIRAELAKGAWMITYLFALGLLSWLGTFTGTSTLPAPYDSIIVALVALVIFYWATRAGRNHIRSAPDGELGIDHALADTP